MMADRPTAWKFMHSKNWAPRVVAGRVLALLSLFVSPPAASAAALNSLTISELAGSRTVNYPVQIGRPFMRGEIAQYPQALVDAVPVLTQADVKSRWSDGSVKHSIITFLVPTLPANGTVIVTFRNQPSGNNTGYLTPSDMLSSGFDLEAVTEISSSTVQSASARAMLQAGAFSYWLQGPVVTSVIVADHSVARPFDLGFDANRSFRPIFHLTFWPSLSKVRVRFVGEIANTEALQDVAYALTLKTGLKSPAVAYAKPTFTHTAGSRWTKEFWIGGAPSAIAIDHNLAYLAATTLIPNYDVTKRVPESALASAGSSWAAASKDLYDAGNWQRAMPTTGGRAEIGPYPTWTVLWLYTGDRRVRDQAFANADLSAAWPIHFREGNSTKFLDRARTVNGLGHVVSISTRATLSYLLGFGYGSTKAGDKINPVGSMTNGGWLADCQHLFDATSPQYLLTGDYWYLEESWFWSGYAAGFGNGAAFNAHYGRGPTGAEGGLYTPVRQQAWSLRNRVNTWSISPDATPEKEYFATLTNDAIAIWEGQRDVTGSAFQGNANWNWGNTTGKAWQAACPVPTPGPPLGVPPLHHWWIGDAAFVQDPIEPATTKCACAPWEQNYMLLVLGRARELGFPTEKLLSWLAISQVSQITDAAYGPYRVSAYRLATVRKSDSQYFPNWSAVATGLKASFDPVADFNTGLNDAEHGRPYIALAGTAAIQQESGGQTAWDWMAMNVLTHPNLSANPKWAILPRSSSPPSPPVLLP